MAAAQKYAPASGDVGAQIAELKARLDSMVETSAVPIVDDAQDRVRERAADLSGWVRSRPITALAITAVVAFVAGRLLR